MYNCKCHYDSGSCDFCQEYYRYNPSVLKVNSGYILVGSIPMQLAYVSQDEKTLTNEFIEAQMRLPSSLRSIKSRGFKTKLEALQSLKQYERE